MIPLISKYFIKPVSILLSVYMINLSIDAADMEGRFDPKVNEIESAVELVLEVIMNKGNVLPEQDEPDPETETCFHLIHHMIPSKQLQLDIPLNSTSARQVGIVLLNYSDPFLSFNFPPPKSGTQTFLVGKEIQKVCTG